MSLRSGLYDELPIIYLPPYTALGQGYDIACEIGDIMAVITDALKITDNVEKNDPSFGIAFAAAQSLDVVDAVLLRP